ncbi:MAG: SGNH/GDSL hydrolase family protein, partial [Proteobacteria bacterium]|nr:SGNH/GDSL hydrolase family protein [Pseudomonadota bacterium]
QETFQKVEVSINQHGFRGPDFKIKKSVEVTRIMVLGDSVVFGWGAPQNAIFPAQLQNLLDDLPGRFEVIPAGVGSWNTRTEFEYLRTTGIAFEPDVIVLLIVANDINAKPTSYTEISKETLFPDENIPQDLGWHLRNMWIAASNRSFLAGYLQYFIRIENAKEQETTFEEGSPHWEDASLAAPAVTASIPSSDCSTATT